MRRLCRLEHVHQPAPTSRTWSTHAYNAAMQTRTHELSARAHTHYTNAAASRQPQTCPRQTTRGCRVHNKESEKEAGVVRPRSESRRRLHHEPVEGDSHMSVTAATSMPASSRGAAGTGADPARPCSSCTTKATAGAPGAAPRSCSPTGRTPPAVSSDPGSL